MNVIYLASWVDFLLLQLQTLLWYLCKCHTAVTIDLNKCSFR